MIFFGTDLFAKELLRFLFDHIEIAAVVTQEDQPQGRNRKVCPPPVKALCLERNFTPIYQPYKPIHEIFNCHGFFPLHLHI